MEKKIIRIAFLGRGRLGMMVLKGLLSDKTVQLAVVINCSPTPEVQFTVDEFKEVALQYAIPFYHTNNINQKKYQDLLESLNIDLGVAMLWLYTISQSIIATAKIGFVNCHSGMLPAYRGNACTNWAILNGEKEVGYSTHFMKGGELDNGPVLLQEAVQVNEKTTILDLVKSFDEVGARLTLETVARIRSGNFKPLLQNDNDASYCYPRLPRDGEINWDLPAGRIEKLVRAAGEPYPGAYSFFADVRDDNAIKKMIVYKAHEEEHSIKFYAVNGHLIRLKNGEKWGVVCGDGKLLILDEISINGKRGPAVDFFKTVRQRFGLDTETLLKEIGMLKAAE